MTDYVVPYDSHIDVLVKYCLNHVEMCILNNVYSIKVSPDDLIQFARHPGVGRNVKQLSVAEVKDGLDDLLCRRVLQVVDDKLFQHLRYCVEVEQPFTWCREGDRFAYPGAIEFTAAGAGLYWLAYEAITGRSMTDFGKVLKPFEQQRIYGLIGGIGEVRTAVVLGTSEAVLKEEIRMSGGDLSSVSRIERTSWLWRDYWWRPPQPMWFGLVSYDN